VYRLILVKVALILCVAVCHPGCAPARESLKIETTLPMPGFAEGWESGDGVQLFNKDTLFNHINGEAELYFPYGFVVAAATTYDSIGTDYSIAAEVYEMGSLLDAFGIYSNYRHPGKKPLDFGGDGFCDASQLMFYQDKYFVRLTALGEWERSGDDLLACGQAIAVGLPQPAREPSEIKMLDFDGVELLSVTYLAESVLGYAFLSKGFVASATLSGESARVFLVLGETETAAEASMQQYIDYLRRNGEEPRQMPVSTGSRMMFKDPLHGGTIVHGVGAYIVGVTGLSDPGEGLPLVERMMAHLQK